MLHCAIKPADVVSYDTNKPTLQVYPELQRAFDHFNERLFEGQLPNTLLTLQRKAGSRGYFHSNAFISVDGERFIHEIALNPDSFAVRNPIEVLSTLVHEMVHLWQYETGDPGRGGYHNKEWGTKMREVGLEPRGGKGKAHDIGDRVTHRIIAGGPSRMQRRN